MLVKRGKKEENSKEEQMKKYTEHKIRREKMEVITERAREKVYKKYFF
jgi:hypothetical protein